MTTLQWISVADRLPDTSRTVLVHAAFHLNLGQFFTAYCDFDVEHPKPRPGGVGCTFEKIWYGYPSGDPVRGVMFWADFNRPSEEQHND